jgi:glucose/mannose-6-phosphate isomerase
MISLDSSDIYARLDPFHMRSHLHFFPQQCLDAWKKGLEFGLPKDLASVDKIVILGMGGSAIGADLVRSLTSSLAKPVISVSRDYELPAYVDDRTLVIACSYSGMTEETLFAFSQALHISAKKLVITSGGTLRKMAEEHGIPVFTVDCVSPPRAALAFSLFPILAVVFRMGYLKQEPDVELMFRTLEEQHERIKEAVPADINPAKQLASKLFGRLPVIYGAQSTAEVARRWKTQINENSKSWAFYETLPELDHNSVVGYRFPKEITTTAFAVMLRNPAFSPRLQLRYEVTSEILEKAGVHYQFVDGHGDGLLSQMMTLVYLGDWVSYYLAILNDVDPTPVEPIDYLKRRLNSIQTGG